MELQNLPGMLVAVVYAISAVGYAAHFWKKQTVSGRIGTGGLFLGWGAHSLFLGLLTVSLGGVPLTSQVLPSLCAWLIVIVYVYLELTTRDRALGALIVPIVTLLHVFALFNLMGADVAPRVFSSGSWFRLHVLAYILAYAAFAISCVSAVMYVMLLGEIQQKHLGFFYERLPSLQVLDQVNNRAATFGFLFLSVGVFLSAQWMHRELHQFWAWNEPAFMPLLVTWVIYAGHLAVRWVAGWRGKRAAFISILGFILVVFAFPVVGVLFPGKHPFG